MKIVYKYDNDHVWLDKCIVNDDYQLQKYETWIKPTDGLYEPIKFDPDSQKWIGTDKDVFLTAHQKEYDAYLKKHPEEAPQPSNEQQAITALAQQIADGNASTESHIKSIEQAITALATGGNA